jgi:aspartyl-tRNA(Asn)/glutamyl-tRNA(Gln) amidotransferase subunit A
MTDHAPALPTLDRLARDLAAGRTTAAALVEDCLAAIADPDGDGALTFISVDAAGARAAAAGFDAMRRAGMAPSPWAGIPIAVKDLFDMAGQETRAGSKVLAGCRPAAQDAPAIARLRRMGFVPIGRTNMTEFAYSGIGTNPHYGTPPARWRREERRIPGGSSSGSAVAVAAGMAHAGIGTDTGGSCRIPAVFNDLVGFKPTARRIPREGVVPLSSSLDSVGPLARSVGCCALLDSIMAGTPEAPPAPAALAGLRLAVPRDVALDALDDEVAAGFNAALRRLSAAGARIETIAMPEFAEVAKLNARGGLTAAESHAWHRALLERGAEAYDPRVLVRLRRGAELSAADYIDLLAGRADLVARARARLAPHDALLMPTVAILPPHIAELDDDAAFTAANLRVLRNPTLINMIDGCAISLPLNAPGAPPVGLMVCGAADTDRRIFAIAAAIEALGPV